MGAMELLAMFMFFLLLLHQVVQLHGQQPYLNTVANDCEKNFTETLGYKCNGDSNSCLSYLTIRSMPGYSTSVSIGDLLNADASQIALINKAGEFPVGKLVVVPVNCSCSGGMYYQHNASYVVKGDNDIYFNVANITYQALTTCQAMIAQNPFNYRQLVIGTKLLIPLRCACPTKNQIAAGFKYLLTYPVAKFDTVAGIGQMFNGVDTQAIVDANTLPSPDFINFFTPILVPLKTEPIIIKMSPPPPSSPPPPISPTTQIGIGNNSSHKWTYIGVGIGAGFLLLLSLAGLLLWFFHFRRGHKAPQGKNKTSSTNLPISISTVNKAFSDIESPWSMSSGIRSVFESLTIYKFEDLRKATGNFTEANRIKGSVYLGSFKGDKAAVKILKGNVSREIDILKQINHSNIIRLSGFCVHRGNTYLVYEYAEEGSMSDWLHSKTKSQTLSWKQRVQIAHDVADALNYLHNYTNPPYIHKDLKSSNILLDSNMRAKISNFGLARSIDNANDEGGAQLTKHVIGTYGYIAPEYIENGLITPQMDVFAFGVLLLELLSGREATASGADNNNGEDEFLSKSIHSVLGEASTKENLREFIDPKLKQEYSLDMAYSMAQLARDCVGHDLNSRPAITELLISLSKIRSSAMDWDPSSELKTPNQ